MSSIEISDKTAIQAEAVQTNLTGDELTENEYLAAIADRFGVSAKRVINQTAQQSVDQAKQKQS